MAEAVRRWRCSHARPGRRAAEARLVAGGVRPYALVSAALAPVALIGGWTLAASRQSTVYDATRDTISALAAAGAADRWIMTVGFVVLGACHLVTALGLRDAARPAGRLLLGLGGVAALLVAVFPEPSAAHVPAASVSFVALALWPAFSGAPTRALGWVAAGVLSVLLVWFGLELGSPRVGLAERVIAGAQVLWPLATVLALLFRRPESARTTSRGAARRAGPS